MALVMMDPNAEAGPSSRPWLPPKATPLVLMPAAFKLAPKPAPAFAPVHVHVYQPKAGPEPKQRPEPILVLDSPERPRPVKRRKTNVEVIIPVRRRKRIVLSDSEDDTETERESSTTPVPRRRPVPPVRVVPPRPPPLPLDVSSYLFNPVAPAIRYKCTNGPLGLGPGPLPARSPKPWLHGAPPFRLHLSSHDGKANAAFEVNGTDAQADVWASSIFWRLPYVPRLDAQESAIRKFIKGRPTATSTNVNGDAKSKAGKVQVETAAEKAARNAKERKEEQARMGRSSSTCITISDDEGEAEVDVQVPHSQTMPIEAKLVSATAAPSEDEEDEEEERERSIAPFAVLTGDARFQSTKAYTSAGAIAYVRPSMYKPLPVKPAPPPTTSQDEVDGTNTFTSEQKAEAGKDEKGEKEEEINHGARDMIARVTRSMLRPPTPPTEPSTAPIRAAARRVAYREHGQTIGAEVWSTIMEFEEKAAEWDGAEKAGDAAEAAAI